MINLRYWHIELELEQMSKYLDLVQTSLSQHLEELEVSYREAMAREMTEEEIAFLDMDYSVASTEAKKDFPQLLLLSFIVTWYSYVEQKLIDLCEELKLSIVIGPKDNEHLDQGVRRAQKFLLKAKNYEMDPTYWQQLVNIGKLRNTIVHGGKRLSCSYHKPDGKSVSYTRDNRRTIYIGVEEGLYRYLQQHDLIKISSPHFAEIVPSLDYCKYLVEFGKELFYKLYTELMPNEHFFRSMMPNEHF